MVIAKGDCPDILLDLAAGMPLGTYFVPRDEKLKRRKCWLAFSVKPEGRLFFAGEHCSTDQAWIQGSRISALEAVDEIVSL